MDPIDTHPLFRFQIICTLPLEVVTINGFLNYYATNHTFVLNLTRPIVQLKETWTESKNRVRSLGIKEQQETVSYEAMNIAVRPLDMYSVHLKKTEIKTAILLRMADTWLIPIVDYFEQDLMNSKIGNYRRMVTGDYKAALLQRFCNFIRNNAINEIIRNSTRDGVTKIWFSSDSQIGRDAVGRLYAKSATSPFSTSLQLEIKMKLGAFADESSCDGDALSVIVKANSPENKYVKHNVSLVLNYESTTLQIYWNKTDTQTRTIYNYDYLDRTEMSGSATATTVVTECEIISVKEIEINIFLTSNNNVIQKITDVNAKIVEENTSRPVCSEFRQNLREKVNEFFAQGIRQFLLDNS